MTSINSLPHVACVHWHACMHVCSPASGASTCTRVRAVVCVHAYAETAGVCVCMSQSSNTSSTCCMGCINHCDCNFLFVAGTSLRQHLACAELWSMQQSSFCATRQSMRRRSRQQGSQVHQKQGSRQKLQWHVHQQGKLRKRQMRKQHPYDMSGRLCKHRHSRLRVLSQQSVQVMQQQGGKHGRFRLLLLGQTSCHVQGMQALARVCMVLTVC